MCISRSGCLAAIVLVNIVVLVVARPLVLGQAVNPERVAGPRVGVLITAFVTVFVYALVNQHTVGGCIH